MSSFALFRLPYEQQCTLIEQTSGEPLEVMSCAELNEQQGFVIAPFAPSSERPILLICPDRVVLNVVPQDFPSFPQGVLSSDSRADYHVDFLNFHAHLTSGEFSKLVLSRSIDVMREEKISPVELFQRACERYPRMFICLVSAPQCGTWLTATPEILLDGKEQQWQTVALAGTMPYEEGVRWSDKNIQEQRYVATYLTEQLERFTSHFTEEGPKTARAGHLAHLRSDFRFTLPDHAAIGDILQAFHPTPAVCGLPKQEAFRFILQYEHHDRSFYSGFMGPLFVKQQTHLFVTLRCMQIFEDHYRLYAGGGILKDSQEEQEWQETEIKLDTMRNIIYNV